MSVDPSSLSDSALEAAIVLAEVRRQASGCLRNREILAELQREVVRRSDLAEIEAMWAQPVAER